MKRDMTNDQTWAQNEQPWGGSMEWYNGNITQNVLKVKRPQVDDITVDRDQKGQLSH